MTILGIIFLIWVASYIASAVTWMSLRRSIEKVLLPKRLIPPDNILFRKPLPTNIAMFTLAPVWIFAALCLEKELRSILAIMYLETLENNYTAKERDKLYEWGRL